MESCGCIKVGVWKEDLCGVGWWAAGSRDHFPEMEEMQDLIEQDSV